MFTDSFATIRYADFIIGVSTQAELSAAELFAKEIHRRTGSLPPVCLGSDGATVTFLTVPSMENKDTFSISRDKETFVFRAGTIRGLIYAYSLFLRKSVFKNGVIEIVEDICGIHSPQKPLRGHQTGYRALPNTYDAWTYDQYFRYYLDMMAFGTNVCEHNGNDSPVTEGELMKYLPLEFIREASRLADTLDLDISLWHANDDNQTEAEALESRRQLYSSVPRLNYLFVPGGDPGEMQADDFIDRCKKISRVLKECHPNAQFHPSAQAPHRYPDWGKVFTDSIKTEPDEIDMVIMGPNHAYPMHELRAKVPQKYPLRFYPDITHNLRCEYPVNFLQDNWHFALASTLSRESVNPRPLELKKLHRIFSGYTVGSVSYSEGVHDDVNKMIWSALEWNENCDIREILLDYARLFMFGADPDAIADTILLMERSWQGDPVENPCIDVVYNALCKLKADFPFLDSNWRFMLLYFRGCCDKLVKLRRTQELTMVKNCRKAMISGDASGAYSHLCTEYSATYTRLRGELDYVAEKLFELIGIQLDTEHYHAYSWERGATLETIDNNVTDRAYLLQKLQNIRELHPEQREIYMHKIANRESVDKDEVYFSVALHGLDSLGVSQVGEFYMDIQGDRPYTKKSPIPMGMSKVYDHFTFKANFGGFAPDTDYNLIIAYKSDKNAEVKCHRICANGKILYEGPPFGGTQNKEFDEAFLVDGFESATYKISKDIFVNGTLSLEISEPISGFKLCELWIKKSE